jgi:mRNA-degrading endonuclease RelE of RelBE toxin-antitoxin system
LKPKNTVVLSRQAEHFFKKLEKNDKTNVSQYLISLEEDAYAGKSLHGDLKENFSLRVGKLRIIYTISEKDNVVYVVAIGPRRSVYQ